MNASRRERRALADTLRSVGPDAPTLCAGWTSRDLAAHLVVRERRLDATPGIAMAFLARYTARVQNRLAQATSWDDLVEMVSAGPPLYSPFRLLDPVVNVGEMFIHHEDVRRAVDGWQPRVLDDSIVASLRRPLALMSRITMGKAPAQLVLQTPAGQRIASIGRGEVLTVTGEPPELLLFVAGRDAARVEFDRDPETVAGVRAARRSL
ncbi:MAG: TIGR03085 family protein [Mycobacterium sp.]|nr:TIGR03085 family protein [Mycobacterium sp.]